MADPAKTKNILILAGLGLAAVLPALTGFNQYLMTILVIMLVFIIYSSAWNLLACSGQGSLGHAAFFGLGGYVSTLAALNLGLSPYLTMFIGGAFAAFIGVLIGLTCVRLKEWFLAMVTFGFAIIIQTLIVTQFSSISGGWDGLASPRLVSSEIPFAPAIEYYSLLAITAGVILVIYLILRSWIGLAFSAIRENELEARASGIDPVKYKLLAFAISAFFAGMAGALEIAHFGYITPEIFGVDISFWPIIYSISGGLATIAGPIIGTIVISLFWEGLRMAGLTYARFIIIGLMLILVVIFLPHGMVSLPEKIKEWRNARKRGRTPDQPPDQPSGE